MRGKSVFIGIALFTALSAGAAGVGWNQAKRVVHFRVLTATEFWFKVENDNTLYAFDPSTTHGKNMVSAVIAAKSTGQKIEWYWDNAITRCAGACYHVYSLGLMP